MNKEYSLDAPRIDRVTFVFQCHSQKTAKIVQEKFSLLFHSTLKKHLADEIKRHICYGEPDSGGKRKTINKITLQLGDIPFDDFEKNLSTRLLLQLSEKLAEIFTLTASRHHSLAQRNNIIPLFMRHLEQGNNDHAFWKIKQESPDTWLSRQINQAPQKWQQAFNTTPLTATMHKRLLSTFDTNTLRQLSDKLVLESSPVNNAGVVLLWPLLASLFKQLQLLEKNAFIDHSTQQHAANILSQLVWGEAAPDKKVSAIDKILCGLSPQQDIELNSHFALKKHTHLQTCLETCLAQIDSLKHLSIYDLRSLLLQRKGTLVQQQNHWILNVESDACDVLLWALPWPIESILLPWMTHRIEVIWKR